MPSASIASPSGSPAARSPAVSSTCSGIPSITMRSRSTSRVVPGTARHDRGLVAGQPVQQRRLAGIGPPGDDDRSCPRSAAGPAWRPRCSARSAAVERRQSRLQRLSASSSISSSAKSIAASTRARSSASASASSPHASENSPSSERNAARAACFGGRIDQTRDRLGLRQIELAIEIGALSKFARPRAARAELERAADQRFDHHRAPVAVQLEHVLTGIGMRRGEIQRQPAIDRSALGIAESRCGGDARRRRPTSRARRSGRHFSGPTARTIAMPPRPGGVAAATMVSAYPQPRRQRPRRAAQRRVRAGFPRCGG